MGSANTARTNNEPGSERAIDFISKCVYSVLSTESHTLVVVWSIFPLLLRSPIERKGSTGF